MELSETQIAQYDEQGYLFFPGLLDADEAAVLQGALPEILSREGPEIVTEKEDASAVRLAFGAHFFSEPFRRLALLPRLLNPVRQLLREDVYLHQSRMNPKYGFGGGASWDWHQDYPPWHSVDGMPEPRCVMASVFIDDCTPVTSPLLIMPGTQRYGLLDASPHKDAEGRGYELHHVDNTTFERLAAEHGIEALIGPAGSVAFIHCKRAARLCEQCLAVAAGDHVSDLQRGRQRLHRHCAPLVSEQSGLHAAGISRRQ